MSAGSRRMTSSWLGGSTLSNGPRISILSRRVSQEERRGSGTTGEPSAQRCVTIRVQARIMDRCMRVLLAVAFTFLTCLGLCDSGWEKNLAEVRAMRLAAPRKWAIVIGASDYAELGELKYARDDAREFAQALIDDFTFKPQDVTLLVDKDKPEIAPTSKNISAQLDRVFKDPRLDKGDLFIFYFNGHGVGTKNGDFLRSEEHTSELQ